MSEKRDDGIYVPPDVFARIKELSDRHEAQDAERRAKERAARRQAKAEEARRTAQAEAERRKAEEAAGRAAAAADLARIEREAWAWKARQASQASHAARAPRLVPLPRCVMCQGTGSVKQLVGYATPAGPRGGFTYRVCQMCKGSGRAFV